MSQHPSDNNEDGRRSSEDGRRFSLEPVERERLLNMLGPEDENIRQIATRLGVEILNSGPNFIVKGPTKMALAAERIIKQLYLETKPVGKQRKAQYITPEKVNLAIIENTHLEADQENSINPLDSYTDIYYYSSIILKREQRCLRATARKTPLQVE